MTAAETANSGRSKRRTTLAAYARRWWLGMVSAGRRTGAWGLGRFVTGECDSQCHPEHHKAHHQTNHANGRLRPSQPHAGRNTRGNCPTHGY